MFSVVIPLYNKEDTILKTIESVLKQKENRFELIIINDGSTDNSFNLVKEVKDKRINIINIKNNGVSFARNLGIKKAKYKWVAFLDADDFWSENHLSEIKKMIMMYNDCNIFVTSYDFLPNFSSNGSTYIVDDFFSYSIYHKLINSSNVVINKNVFDNVGLFNVKLKRGEDVDLWFRIALEYKIVKSESVTSQYNLISENNTLTKKYPFKESFLSTINFSLYKDKNIKKFLYYTIAVSFRKFINNKDFIALFNLIIKFNIKLLNSYFIVYLVKNKKVFVYFGQFWSR